MISESDIFIVCPICRSKNKTESIQCSNCHADLLPDRGLSLRLVFGAVGLLGIAIPVAVFVTSGTLILGPLGLFVWLVVFGFSVAFSHSNPSERLVNRATSHVKLCPNQAVLDATQAYKSTSNISLRCLALEKRGEAQMALGKYQEALSDFQQCVSMPLPGSRYLMSDSVARGAMQNTIKMARSKIEDIHHITGS